MLMTLPALPNPQEIIDQSRLESGIAGLSSGGEFKPKLHELLRSHLKHGRQTIEARFMAHQDGAATVAAGSYLMDCLIRALFNAATTIAFPTNQSIGEKLAILAVGGYGRQELAPQSDVDLLFVLPHKPNPYTEQIVEFMLYTLWDLGLKVGHATRSIDDTLRQAQADFTIRTGLLEARHLCGNQELSDQLLDRFNTEVIEGSGIAFVEAKLAEREQRYQRMGDSRYVLEPNIKEGKGGLRDLHSLFWIAKYLFHVYSLPHLVQRGILLPAEARRFARAQNFLWTVRCHLHYLTNRPEERLTFDVQAEIGRRMGYADRRGSRGVERFMKHFFLVAKDVGDLTGIFIAAIDSELKRTEPLRPPPPPPQISRPIHAIRRARVDRFPMEALPLPLSDSFVIEAGRIASIHDAIFVNDPVNLIRLFHLAQTRQLDIHPRVLRAVTRSLRLVNAHLRQDAEANRLFMEILTSPLNSVKALRRMNEAGVLGRFIPDFGRIVSQMQYDMYHVYTVDEHTIHAIGILHRLETGELKDETLVAPGFAETGSSRRALYVAMMLHDIAKGRGGDHSELGVKVAEKLCPRLGLTPEETETVGWLIRYHLLMSRTAFKRDLDDPKTIVDFVNIVQSPERLKLLALLTTADIRAVGPGVWNGWKGSLLRDLYDNSLELMSGALSRDSRDKRLETKQHQTRELLGDFTDEDFEALVSLSYPYFWLSSTPPSLARQARLMRDADRANTPLTVDACIDADQAATEVTVYTGDHAGLFSRLAGALAIAGSRIVDARIVTMKNGMALDTFWVQDPGGGAYDQPDKLARLPSIFEGILAGRIDVGRELNRGTAYPSRARVFTVTPRVLIDNKASSTHTIIEVNGRDRPALLFDLTRSLTELGLSIASAKISTYGEKVVDVFYVKDVFGLKIDDDHRCLEIRHALTEVLEGKDRSAALRISA